MKGRVGSRGSLGATSKDAECRLVWLVRGVTSEMQSSELTQDRSVSGVRFVQ